MDRNLAKPIENSGLPNADALRSVHTTNLPAIFEQLQISLVVSTYQAGKVTLIRNANGVL